jgi:hypothetical protein
MKSIYLEEEKALEIQSIDRRSIENKDKRGCAFLFDPHWRLLEPRTPEFDMGLSDLQKGRKDQTRPTVIKFFNFQFSGACLFNARGGTLD